MFKKPRLKKDYKFSGAKLHPLGQLAGDLVLDRVDARLVQMDLQEDAQA